MPDSLPDRISRDNMGWLLAARQQVAQARIVLSFVEQRIATEHQIGPRDSIGADGTIQRALTEAR